MYLKFLSLTNFRSYSEFQIQFEKKINILLGNNGQGKTNILEAIYFISTGESHRVSSHVPLIKESYEQAIIRIEQIEKKRKTKIEFELNKKKQNRVKINGVLQRNTKEVKSASIIFSPEDLFLAKGDPQHRRAFMDIFIKSTSPRMQEIYQNYEKILKQRTSLLKTIQNQNKTKRTLDIWNEKLATFGSEIIFARLQFLDRIAPFVTKNYKKISLNSKKSASEQKTFYFMYEIKISKQHIEENNKLCEWENLIKNTAHFLNQPAQQGIEYIKKLLLYEIEVKQADEIFRGANLVGPHRHDMSLFLDTLPVKGYASHGETWSVALALKLATYDLLKTDIFFNEDPILLLDDVFAELDDIRRTQLIKIIENNTQTIITVASENDIPKEITGKIITL